MYRRGSGTARAGWTGAGTGRLAGPGRPVTYSTPKYLLALGGQSDNEQRKARDLSQVARALSSSDPARAERIARSITDESQKGEALGAILAETLRAAHDEVLDLLHGSRSAEQAFLTVFLSDSPLGELT